MVTGVSNAIVPILGDNNSGDCRTQTGDVVRGSSVAGVSSGVCEGVGVDVVVGDAVDVAVGVWDGIIGVELGTMVIVADGSGVNVWVAVGLGVSAVGAEGIGVGVSPKAMGKRAMVNCR